MKNFTNKNTSPTEYEEGLLHYLDNIKRYPPLKPAEHTELFTTLRRLEEESLLNPDNPTLLGKITRYKNKIAIHNLALVISIAKKYHNSDFSLADRIQEGNLGLLHAINKYDVTLGYQFSTYATPWIHQSISRAISSKARTIRIPTHLGEDKRKIDKALRTCIKEEDTTEDTVHSTDDTLMEHLTSTTGMNREKIRSILSYYETTTTTPLLVIAKDGGESEHSGIIKMSNTVEDEVIKQDTYRALEKAIKKFPILEQDLLNLRFGLENNTPLSLANVARETGISRPYASKLLKACTRKLSIILHSHR